MMVRFVFGCAFFLGISILAVPIYYGVAQQRATMTASVETQDPDTVSFEEIYEVASEAQTLDASALNNISPAAGPEQPDEFSMGFRKIADPALAEELEETANPTKTE